MTSWFVFMNKNRKFRQNNNVIVLSFLFSSFSVSSLKCYNCYSQKSFEDCDKNRELVSCEYDKMKRCNKVTYQLPNTRVYRKECMDLAYCKDNDRYCRQVTDSDSDDCDVLCCKGDKCNPGSKISLSAIAYACAMLTVFIRLLP